MAVPRAYQYAVDEARWRTLAEGVQDDRPEIIEHGRSAGTWLRSPILIAGEALGVILAYVLTGVPMLIAVIRRRAPVSRLFWSPLTAVFATVAAMFALGALDFLFERAGGARTEGSVMLIRALFFPLFGFLAGMLYSRSMQAVTTTVRRHQWDPGSRIQQPPRLGLHGRVK